jgi:phosphoribosyl 1,2-cyclic phosphodiesterase
MPAKIRSKISSVAERFSERDLESQEAREHFLMGLPEYLFSSVGGNTSCVELLTGESDHIVFDAGTGIRELGIEMMASKRPTKTHLFFSHFHWDHIQGLPFFAPAFDPRNTIDFYSPVANFRRILEDQMREPYFPITMDTMVATKRLSVLQGEPVRLGGVRVGYRSMNHPGGCYSYRVEEAGKKVIYSTDTELRAEDFDKTPENSAYFDGVDALIIDTQYTLGEAIEKYNWGHSSFSLAADFAVNWGIKRLVLFHHDPAYSDRKIYSILQNASWYIEHLEGRGIEITLAKEGLELDV